MESLTSLARDYNRTVIFTIHQPRSNIVALFDQLVLLAKGKLVYSGALSECQAYFAGIGQPCPPGFNIADYLSACLHIPDKFKTCSQCTVDLTMNADKVVRPTPSLTPPTTDEDDASNIPDEERALSTPHAHAVPLSVRSSNDVSTSTANEETELRTRPNSIASQTSNFLKRKTSQLLEVVTSSSKAAAPLAPELAALVNAYATSAIAAEIKAETEEIARVDERGNGGGDLRDVEVESTLLRGRTRASWGTQFRILSGRAFKNLYRDPALLTAHYVSSVALACESTEPGFGSFCAFLLMGGCSVLWDLFPSCHVRFELVG